MNLLLTSAGLTNPSITKALFDMVGKKPQDTTLVFIPTAANIETGDKDWFIDDLANLSKQGFKAIHITDISAVDESVWLPQLELADVLYFEGGNTFHLMRWLDRSGLSGRMRDLLKTRVYVGVSAGSMVTGPDLILKTSQLVYGEDLAEKENLGGLGLVDFYILPHLNSPWFEKVRVDTIRIATRGMTTSVYALDDQGAVKVTDGKIEVVSEGKWEKFN